jgi:hypothetical protein
MAAYKKQEEKIMKQKQSHRKIKVTKSDLKEIRNKQIKKTTKITMKKEALTEF